MDRRRALWIAGFVSVLVSARTAPATPSAPSAPATPATAAMGKAADGDSGAAPLRVVVVGSAPFVTHPKPGGPSGMSVEVWARAAHEMGRRYELELASGVQEALDAVRAGRADVAVGPLSITAQRAEQVAFSQPYFASSLGILAPARSSLFDRVKPFVTRAFLGGVGVLLLVLSLVGTLTWLFERRRNADQFPSRPIPGIANGLWMALVTMTTVGYGDRVPQTTAGRTVTGIWMLVSMIVASSLTASLATAFTLSQIDRPSITSADDLADRPVGAVQGTTSVRFAEGHDARVRPAPNLEHAVEALESNKTAALVFDRPILRYYLREHPDAALSLAPARYQPQGYGFALPFDSPLRTELDVALLRLQANGELEAIAKKWLGP